jgi:hypothetical protein
LREVEVDDLCAGRGLGRGLERGQRLSAQAEAGLAKSRSQSTRSAARVPPKAASRSSKARPVEQKFT